MKLKVAKDKRYRELYSNYENLQLLDKFMIINILNHPVMGDYFIQGLYDRGLTKREVGNFLASRRGSGITISKTKLVRRCVFTGRARVNYSKKIKVSRIKLREVIRSGLIPGYSRAIW